MDALSEHNGKAAMRLLTPDEAAEQLNITAKHIRALIRRGQLSAINIGTGAKRPLYRITQRALDEFMNPNPKPEPTDIRKHPTRQPPVHDYFPTIK